MTNNGFQQKGWGYEIIFASNESYCGKILCFNREGAKTSLHFHKERDKTWFVNSGQLKLQYIETGTGALNEVVLKEGDTFRIKSLQPHLLQSLTKDAMVFEVSTNFNPADTYRIFPGDSQQVEQNGSETNKTNI